MCLCVISLLYFVTYHPVSTFLFSVTNTVFYCFFFSCRRMSVPRRWQPAALIVAALLVAVFLATTAACVDAAESDETAAADPYAYLDMLAETDLKKMLFEKTGGRVNLDTYRRKADLVAAVRQLEEHEEREAQFNAQVEAALARKAAAAKKQQQHAANSNDDSNSAAAHVAASNGNNEHHNNKRAVQLIDDDDDDIVRKEGMPAQHRAPSKAGRVVAKHKLEVLYCTG